MIEIAKDPSLFQAVREEVKSAYKIDPATQQPVIDAQTLVSLPILQSVYAEILRLHVSINITREVVGPIAVEGHSLKKGALVQAPSEIAHCDERTWAVDGHPASEFWAMRHVQYVEKDQ